MKRYYCTYFNYNYLPTFLSLYDSMLEHCGNFQIFCICMDSESREYLEEIGLERAVVLDIFQVENELSDLKSARYNRSLIEFFFTSTSSINYFILTKYPEIDWLTYLDADLFFFSSPEPIFNELKGKSIGIIEHKFHGLGKRNLKYGKFNVGWISFKNNEEGINCLKDWREKCIEWCFDKLEEGKFADQKYLNDWPVKYPSTHIINHIGANVGPWNVGQYLVSIQANNVMVNDQKLIFYHFASFKRLSEKVYSSSLSKYYMPLKGKVKSLIYGVYAKSIFENSERMSFKVNGEVRKTRTDRGKITFTGILNEIRYRIFNDKITID